MRGWRRGANRSVPRGGPAARRELEDATPARALERYAEAGRRSGLLSPELADGLERRWRVFQAHAAALAAYRPAAYPGPVLLLEAERVLLGDVQAEDLQAEKHRAAAFWRPLLGDRLRVETVPGDHFTILHGAPEDGAARVASLLHRRLRGTGTALVGGVESSPGKYS